MFIGVNGLRGVIVDLDSLPSDLDLEWTKVPWQFRILFYSQDEIRLRRIRSLKENFIPYIGTLGRWELDRDSLSDMLKTIGFFSYEVAFLSKSRDTLSLIGEVPLATIYFDDALEFDYNLASKLSDFVIESVDELNQVLLGEISGYLAEHNAIRINEGIALKEAKSKIIITNIDRRNTNTLVVSGGRYFSSKDPRHHYHQLSQRIVRSKNISQASIFTPIYEKLIWVVDGVKKVDGITRVPPRPGDKDRFFEIVDAICKNGNYQNMCEDLICSRFYPTQRVFNEAERRANVRGAFSSSSGVEGKHIVLLDDITVTTATTMEAAKAMYEQGAQRVTVVVLGISQFEPSNRRDVPLTCNICGREMKMRFRGDDETAFFGCTGFAGNLCSNTIDYLDGITEHNILNAGVLEPPITLDDIPF